jgi:hypothetical protein
LLQVVGWANLTSVTHSLRASFATFFTTLEHEEGHVDWAVCDGEGVGVVGGIKVDLYVPGPISELEPGHQHLRLQLEFPAFEEPSGVSGCISDSNHGCERCDDWGGGEQIKGRLA